MKYGSDSPGRSAGRSTRARTIGVTASLGVGAAVLATTAIVYAGGPAPAGATGAGHDSRATSLPGAARPAAPGKTTPRMPATTPRAGHNPEGDEVLPAPPMTSMQFRTIDSRMDPTFNQLLGIDDRGRIVGYFGSGADAKHPNKGYAIRPPYVQTSFHNENVPGSAQTQVVGVNNAGTTVGFFVGANGDNVGFVTRPGGGFTTVVHPATPMKNSFNQLLGVNDKMVAAGFYNDMAGNSHGYTYNIRTMMFKKVSVPVAATSVTATGINDKGDVSGFYTTSTKMTFGFLLAHNGRFSRIKLGAGTNTQALGVNDQGRVVGSFVDGAGHMHGFVWSMGSGRQVDDPMGAGGTLVNGLNNRGQLVGFYVDRAGMTHGFLANGTR